MSRARSLHYGGWHAKGFADSSPASGLMCLGWKQLSAWLLGLAASALDRGHEAHKESAVFLSSTRPFARLERLLQGLIRIYDSASRFSLLKAFSTPVDG